MNNQLYENLKLYWPFVQDLALSYEEISDYEIMVKLSDGRIVLYDDFDHTLRRLPTKSEAMTDEEFKQESSTRLKRSMYRKGVTQLDLAERTGISQPQISSYVNGKVFPSFYYIDKIAKALKCSADDFRYI